VFRFSHGSHGFRFSHGLHGFRTSHGLHELKPLKVRGMKLGIVIVSLDNVTRPLDKSLPVIVVFAPTVILPRVRIVPTNVDILPNVTEPATCQKILEARMPPVSVTDVSEPVVRVPVVWKMTIAVDGPLIVNVPLFKVRLVVLV